MFAENSTQLVIWPVVAFLFLCACLCESTAYAQLANCSGGNCPATYAEPQACGTLRGRDNTISVLIGGSLTITQGAESEGKNVVLGNLVHAEAANETFNIGYSGVGACVAPAANTDYLVVGGNIISAATRRLIVGGLITSGNDNIQGNLRIKGSILPTNLVIDIGGSIIPDPALDLTPYQQLIQETATLSSCLASQSQTAGLTVTLQNNSNGLTITNTNGPDGISQTYYATVNAATWPNANIPVIINGFDNSDVLIINVSGIAPTMRVSYFQRDGLTTEAAWNTFRQRILWNFFETNALTFNAPTVGWEGSVIAPVATSVSMNLIAVNGRFLTSGDVTLTNPGFEFHNYPWQGGALSCSSGGSVTANSLTVCAGQVGVLSVSGCTGNVQWEGPGSFSSNATSLSILTATSVTTPTQLSYSVRCTTGTGSASAVSVLTIQPLPSVTLTASSSQITLGTPVTLSALGCDGRLVWSVSGTGTAITITPANPTSVYAITCTSSAGCSTTASIAITVSPTDLSIVVTNALICLGQSTTLSVVGCSGSVRWSQGSSATNLIVSLATTTPYSVTCQDGLFSSTASTSIQVIPLPALSITTSAQSVSQGQSVTLTASGCQNGTLEWSTGEINQFSQVVSPMLSTIYSVTCLTGPGCFTAATILINVASPPQPTLYKAVNKTRVQMGELLSYTVTVVNTSSLAASQVVVRDSLSSGLSLVPGSIITSSGSVTSAGSVTSWGLASLPANATATLTFSASVLTEGVVYNTAILGTDTNRVCTSVPVKFCVGTVIYAELEAPAGYTSYQWYRNGSAIALATGNSFTATEVGEYSVLVNAGLCPSGSCCPIIIELDSVPAFSLMAKSPTCVGNLPQETGSLTVMGLGTTLSQYRFAISTGSSFTEVNGSTAPIPSDGLLAANLAGNQDYTVRIFNSLGCYRDVTVRIVTNCECPADRCTPVVIKKTKARITTP